MIGTVLFQRGNVPLRDTLLKKAWKERTKKEGEHKAILKMPACRVVQMHNFIDT